MQFLSILFTALLSLSGIANVAASPMLEKRASDCNCNGKKRDLNAVSEPALSIALPVIDTANTPDPTKDNCLKQLEQYGVYADPRCAGYGAPVDLINSYRGERASARKAQI
ncbi:hypothetical protein TWF281_004753 [Arthrobotrys megalospora]